MNKKIFFCGICILIAAVFAVNYDWEKHTNLGKIESRLGVELPDKYEIVFSSIDYQGWLGDGECCFKIIFGDDADGMIKNALLQNEFWHQMPATENVTRVLFEGNLICNEKFRVQEFEEGYWFFHDDYDGALNPNDDSLLFERNSHNFTIAAYDSQNHILYFIEADS